MFGGCIKNLVVITKRFDYYVANRKFCRANQISWLNHLVRATKRFYKGKKFVFCRDNKIMWTTQPKLSTKYFIWKKLIILINHFFGNYNSIIQKIILTKVIKFSEKYVTITLILP